MRRSFLEDVPWFFSAIGIDETMCEGNCQLLSSANYIKDEGLLRRLDAGLLSNS
jgi:hypothetical protein